MGWFNHQLEIWFVLTRLNINIQTGSMVPSGVNFAAFDWSISVENFERFAASASQCNVFVFEYVRKIKN